MFVPKKVLISWSVYANMIYQLICKMVRRRGSRKSPLVPLKKFGITTPRVLGSLHAHSQGLAP